jgi:magnesium transporter
MTEPAGEQARTDAEAALPLTDFKFEPDSGATRTPSQTKAAPDARLLTLDSTTGTAAEHLLTAVIRASPDERCGELRTRLAGGIEVDSVDLVFLVDPDNKLLGLVPTARVLACRPDTPLSAIALSQTPAVRAGTDQEQAANLAIAHGLGCLPVVDVRGHLIGVIPARALLDVLRREHVEDLHRLAGLSIESKRAREAIDAPPLRRARDRLPWLLIGLVGSAGATALVAHFEAALQAHVAVAFFIPAIVYLADAVGTQSEAVAVREISLSRRPLRRIIVSEVRTGLIIGAVLAVAALLGVWSWHQDARLALAVSASLFTASLTASLSGFALPWAIARGGHDPAYGSGPLATIVQDLLSLTIYFATVSILMGS